MSEVMKQTGASDVRTGDAREEERRAAIRPPVDVFENTDGITLLLDMPGVSKERLSLEIDRTRLVVEGEVAFDMHEEMQSLYADVRSTRYHRSFSLRGEQLDTDNVQATMKDGVLRIEIPRRAELRPRKIEVKAA